MTIDRIIYSKLFPLGQFTNEKIGVEIQVDKTDDTQKAFEYAKEIVEKWHKESNPGLYVDVNPAANSNVEQIREYHRASDTPVPAYDPKAIDDLEIAIDNATTLEGLANHKEAASKLGLVQHYMDRLKVLSK